MIDLKAYQEAFQHLPQGAAEAEVNAETHDIISVTVEGGRTADVQLSSQTALFVRVSGEKTGYVYTQDLSEDAGEVLRRAYDNSLISAAEKPEQMNRSGSRTDLGEIRAEENVSLLRKKAADLEAAVLEHMKTDGCRVSLIVNLQSETFGQHTVNSHGLDTAALRPLYILTIYANADFGTSHAVVCFDQTKNSADAFDPEFAAANLSRRIRQQKDPQFKFESGEYPVILSDEAVFNLFATAWQEFAGHKYAGGVCALAGQLGEKIAAECLSITDYPAADESGYEMVCDAEGTVGRPVSVIRNGVFAGLMNNAGTAAETGTENSGNAGRRPLMFGNIATDILVTPRNFCLEPGEASLEEMMAHMGDGILITEYFDLFHTLDIASGDFSAPCFGVRIRDGKECGNYQALTVTGNICELLKRVQEVGSTRIVHPMVGTQSYAIGSCPLRISALMISGEH